MNNRNRSVNNNRVNNTAPFNPGQIRYIENLISDTAIIYSGVNTANSSMTFLRGNGEPSSQLGINGDLYIDMITGIVYQKINGKWIILFVTGSQKGDKGDKGNIGSNGSSFISADGPPSTLIGTDGDTYLDLTTDDLYTKTNGVWTISGNVQGSKGDKGDSGMITTTPGYSAVYDASSLIVVIGANNINPVPPNTITSTNYNIDGMLAPNGIATIPVSGFWQINTLIRVSNSILTIISSLVGNYNISGYVDPVPLEFRMGSLGLSTDYTLAAPFNVYLTAGTTISLGIRIVVAGILGPINLSVRWGMHLLSAGTVIPPP